MTIHTTDIAGGQGWAHAYVAEVGPTGRKRLAVAIEHNTTRADGSHSREYIATSPLDALALARQITAAAAELLADTAPAARNEIREHARLVAEHEGMAFDDALYALYGGHGPEYGATTETMTRVLDTAVYVSSRVMFGVPLADALVSHHRTPTR
jgi:hypothetical protein